MCAFRHSKRFLISASWVLLFALSVEPSAAASRPAVRIGVVLDGPWERNEEVLGYFQQEISDLLSGEFDVRFPPGSMRVDGWTAPGVREALSGLLADPEVDMVLALGVLGSNCACLRGNLPKPVLAPVVLDADLQGLPQKDGASGVRNLSYTAFPNPIRRHLEVFRQIVPFRKLALLTTSYYMEALQGIRTRFPAVAREMGIGLQVIVVEDSADQALSRIDPDVDAVYLTPLLHLKPPEFDRLVQGLIEKGLPSFSLLGRSEVDKGVFAGVNGDDLFPRLARRVALNIQRILLGEEAGSLPLAFPPRERLCVNMATARAIRVWPPFSVLGEAELLHEEAAGGERKVSLFDAVQEAVRANLDLAEQERAVAAGAEEVKKARARLLPSLELQAAGRILDADRAEASFGAEAERKAEATAALSQALFSEPAWAALSIEKRLQEAREFERDERRLDVVLLAATAYLDLLRAKTFERIEKENLKLTRSNLELAQVRQSIGISGPAELYRWESEIARSRQAVLKAVARREQAERALNRILHRPLAEPFVTEEIDLADPKLATSDPRLATMVSTPWHLETFRDFLVAEGLAASVELRRVEAAIAAATRRLESARRAWWAPSLGIQAEVSRILAEAGAGKEGPSIPGFSSGLVPQADDTNWSVGFKASLPLFQGGARLAEQEQAAQELLRFETQRASLREKLEQRIQSALLRAKASFPSIGLARDASDAARRNLDLVTDAYSRGVVSILDLLDAQNAALVADQVAANSIYDFLLDLMELERATNRFDFFLSPEDRESWFERLDAFVAERRREGS